MIEIASIAQAVAVMAACWAIVSGVGAWKREFIGKRQIELAEQLLTKFFEVRDAIDFIRSPFSSLDEGRTRKRGANESPEESDLLDRGYVVIERYEKRENVFSEFNTLKYRCMATFGAETEKLFIELNHTLNSIFSSARRLATHYWKVQGRRPMGETDFQRHIDEMLRHEGIFWDSGAEDDEIRKKLRDIQSSLEQVTAHCFREPMTLYAILTTPWPSANPSFHRALRDKAAQRR